MVNFIFYRMINLFLVSSVIKMMSLIFYIECYINFNEFFNKFEEFDIL